MLVTIALALLTGAAALAVLIPLARARKTVDADDTDTRFYAAQLVEIERDAGRGLLPAEEAETARVEAARRLLAARRRAGATAVDGAAGWRRKAAAIVGLVGLPLFSLPLYLSLGSPDMPGQPVASRSAPATGKDAIDFEQAVARIEGHLAANPEDGRGWDLLAPLYMSMGRFDDGVRAFGNASRILGETAARLDAWGEALVAAADGVVTSDARAVLDRALAKDPKLTRARFYRALGAEQDGERERAIATFSELASEAAPGSPLARSLSERISKLGGTPPPGAAIAAMPQNDQMNAIRGMVQGLADRLAQDGSDVEGWLRLVRSYAVLNEQDKARDALARAETALAGNAEGRQRLDALAKELGMGGS